MKKLLILWVFVLLSSSIHAQTLKDLDDLKAERKKCQDTSMHRDNCAHVYCIKMEELLSKAYDNLINASVPDEKEELVEDHNRWLKHKKLYYDSQWKQYKRAIDLEGWKAEFAAASVYENDADFVNARVLVLMMKYNKNRR